MAMEVLKPSESFPYLVACKTWPIGEVRGDVQYQVWRSEPRAKSPNRAGFHGRTEDRLLIAAISLITIANTPRTVEK